MTWACSEASQKVTSEVWRVWDILGNNDLVREDGECYQHSWKEYRVQTLRLKDLCSFGKSFTL